MKRTVQRFGRKSIIATHENGHLFFSASGHDYESNEKAAVSQLDALARLASLGRKMRRERAGAPK